MKTAVLISGEARTFARCLPSLQWTVFRKLINPQFFVSVAKDDDAKSMELLLDRYPDTRIEVVEQPTLDEPPAQLADHAPYAISSSIQAILRQLWFLSRVWRFHEEQAKGEKFDAYVRCRPDLHLHRFRTAVAGRNEAVVPWWDTYGGINDRFAVLGPTAASAYFQTWDVLPELLAAGCPLHPESLVCAALERAGVVIDATLAAEFSCRRKDGTLVFPRPQAGEICDYISAGGAL
jgi:hypothetical protein